MFKLPENLESKYAFISMASKRAEQLQGGALPKVAEGSKKVTVIAQREVAEGIIGPYDPEAEAEGEAVDDSEE
jgi:DNA-directed RNA polymerase omega subunit